MRWVTVYLVCLHILLILPAVSALNCVDSDGGEKPDKAGSVTLFDEDGIAREVADFCVDPAGGVLREFNCAEGAVSSTLIHCNGSCSGGRCHTAPVYQCNDSDNGLDPYNGGVVHGKGTPDASESTFRDYCLNRSVVMEYRCEDNLVSPQALRCPGECEGGACIHEGAQHVQCDEGRLVFRQIRDTGSCNASFCENVSDVACCSGERDCVYQGECYSSQSTVEMASGTIVCEEGVWQDPDASKELCEAGGFRWARLGEDHFIGGYEREIYDCCGDDQGEFVAGQNQSTCCDASNDTAMEGVCYGFDARQDARPANNRSASAPNESSNETQPLIKSEDSTILSRIWAFFAGLF